MTSPTPSQASAQIFQRFFELEEIPSSLSSNGQISVNTIFQRFFTSDIISTDGTLKVARNDQPIASVPLKPLAEQTQQQLNSVEKSKSSVLSLSALKTGLSKTRGQLAGKILQLFSNKSKIDEDLIESIETQLLMSDVGITATKKIVSILTEDQSAPIREDQVKLKLKKALLACLEIDSPTEFLAAQSEGPTTKAILVVGVNGAGKTTTIGKLALHLKNQGKSVMLAAGDTFRAAAVEQLQVWGDRNQVPVVAQDNGADSASVIFDALSSAQAKGVDVLIADTAGRLHNKSNLMEELIKIQRVMKKLDPNAPHEVMLVVDGGTGQNALNQGREFHRAMGLTGIVITKLDGTAKGGVLFALVDELGVPVRFIGVGEKAEDLRDFSAENFVDALIDA